MESQRLIPANVRRHNEPDEDFIAAMKYSVNYDDLLFKELTNISLCEICNSSDRTRHSRSATNCAHKM
jgi:hypothetical protein